MNGLRVDKNGVAIAQTIIRIVKTLGMEVVAAGVESLARSEMLKQFGCHIYQGYLLAKPSSVEAFKRDL